MSAMDPLVSGTTAAIYMVRHGHWASDQLCIFLQNGDATFSIFICNFWEFNYATNILLFHDSSGAANQIILVCSWHYPLIMPAPAVFFCSINPVELAVLARACYCRVQEHGARSSECSRCEAEREGVSLPLDSQNSFPTSHRDRRQTCRIKTGRPIITIGDFMRTKYRTSSVSL